MNVTSFILQSCFTSWYTILLIAYSCRFFLSKSLWLFSPAEFSIPYLVIHANCLSYLEMDTTKNPKIKIAYRCASEKIFKIIITLKSKLRKVSQYQKHNMEETFANFSKFGDSKSTGKELDNKKFSKLCKDTGIMGKLVTSTDVDICFSKHKPWADCDFYNMTFVFMLDLQVDY